MTTILRSYKYINFLTGHYLKTYQSNYYSVQHVLKSQNVVANNIHERTILNTEFIDIEPITDGHKWLENVKSRYSFTKHSTYEELINLFNCMNAWSFPTYLKMDLLQEIDIQILIRCCGNAMKDEMPNKRGQAINMLWQLLKTKNLHSNLLFYNELLRVYLENEQDFSPAEILLEMSNNNIQPDFTTYEYSLRYYCQKGNIEEANRILNYLKDNEIPINENIFNALIVGNAKAKDMASAINILKIMASKGVAPSSGTYTAITEAYAMEGKIDDIMQAFEECTRKNMKIPDKFKMKTIYSLAINGYTEYVPQIMSTFTWDPSFNHGSKNLISILMYRKKVDAAIQVLLETKKHNLSGNKLTAMMRPFGKNIVLLNLPKETVINYCDLLEENGLHVYDEVVYNYLKTEHATDYAITLLRAWKKRSSEVKEHYFWPILKQLSRMNNEGIFEILKLMKKEFGINPSSETLKNFVLHDESYNSREIMKKLIYKLEFSPRIVVNAILQHDLSRNKIASAAECILASPSYIYLKTGVLKPLLEKALEVTNDKNSYHVINSMLGERPNKRDQTYLRDLHTVKLHFDFVHYAQDGDLLSTEKCFNEIMSLPGNKIDTDKTLSYFDLLIKKDRIADALQLLQDISSKEKNHTVRGPSAINQYLNSLSLLVQKGSVEGVQQLFKFITAGSKDFRQILLDSLVEVHIVRNDISEAMRVAKNNHEQSNYIPAKFKLMTALIKNEEVESLQSLTDFSMLHQGEAWTLMPLAIAFLICQRPRQCRRILESASQPIKSELVRVAICQILGEGNVSALEKLIKATEGLTTIDNTILYEMLLETYYLSNNFEEGLKLWKEMQEKNVIPSNIFSIILIDLLNKNKQSIPSPMLQNTSEMGNEEDDFHTKILKIYSKRQIYPCKKFLDEITKNVIETGNLEAIHLIDDMRDPDGKFQKKSFKFETYANTDQMHSYLSNIQKKVEERCTQEVTRFANSAEPSWTKYFLIHPESIETFASLANKIYSENNDLYKPSLAVLSYYFLTDEAKAIEMTNALNVLNYGSSIKFILDAYIMSDCIDKLPQLIKSIHKCKNLKRKLLFESFLDAYDKRNKFAEGYEFLLRSVNLQIRNNKEKHNQSGNIKSQIAL